MVFQLELQLVGEHINSYLLFPNIVGYILGEISHSRVLATALISQGNWFGHYFLKMDCHGFFLQLRVIGLKSHI